MFGESDGVFAAAAGGGVILAHGAMGPWDEIAVGVPVPVLFAVLLVIGRRSRRIAFEDDEDLEYSGADSFDGGADGDAEDRTPGPGAPAVTVEDRPRSTSEPEH